MYAHESMTARVGGFLPSASKLYFIWKLIVYINAGSWECIQCSSFFLVYYVCSTLALSLPDFYVLSCQCLGALILFFAHHCNYFLWLLCITKYRLTTTAVVTMCVCKRMKQERWELPVCTLFLCDSYQSVLLCFLQVERVFQPSSVTSQTTTFEIVTDKRSFSFVSFCEPEMVLA